MRIVVAVKYVPDIHHDRQIDDGRLVRNPDDGTLNELDEHAIEAALQIIESLPQEQQDSSEVIALTMGPPAADLVIRKAYQAGVHRGIRITDPAIGGSDYSGTARVLAAAIRHLTTETPIDLVITGMAALDGLGGVIPTVLAAELNWPALTGATAISVDDASAIVAIHREVANAHEELQADAPVVVSVTDEANTPRMPNFKLIMAARRKSIEEWTLADLEIDPMSVGTVGSQVRVIAASPRPPRPPATVVTDRGEGGIALAEFLMTRDLV